MAFTYIPRLSAIECLSAATPHWWRLYASAMAGTWRQARRSLTTFPPTLSRLPVAGRSTRRAGPPESAGNWPPRRSRKRSLLAGPNLAGRRKPDGAELHRKFLQIPQLGTINARQTSFPYSLLH